MNKNKLYGLIPAAGKGVRVRPYTKKIPKGMLKINGTPVIEKIIIIMRDDLGIKDIIIITGYRGELIKEHFGDGSSLGVQISYVDNDALDRGLAYSVLLGREHIDGYFCMMLSDECYIGSNHRDMTAFPYDTALATCAALQVDDTEVIKKNYSIFHEGSRITGLIEKPREPHNNIMGCGTFILSPEIFSRLEKEFKKTAMGFIDFITFINTLCIEKKSILRFELKGTYVNINDRDSLNLAKYLESEKDFHKTVKSLIIYSEGIETNIHINIEKFKKLDELDNIYVYLPENNINEEKIIHSGVQIIKYPPAIKHFGEKLKFALDNTPGDILILTEAGYTFPGRDVSKLLTYIRETDMVVGTRTTRQLIQQGTNMSGKVRITNILLAYLIVVLWWKYEGRFTDVGCIFRAIWKSAFDEVKDDLTTPGPGFLAEMSIELLRRRMRVLEIPVNYYSSNQLLKHDYQKVRIFFHILFLIFKKFFQHIIR